MANVPVEEAIEVATEVAEEVINSNSQLKLQFVALGFAAGAAAGAVATYLVAGRKLETKYQQLAEEEIAYMREHYQAKLAAKEDKPSLDEIIEERGYASTEGDTLVPAPEEEVEIEVVPEVVSSPVQEEEEIRNVFQDAEVVEVDDAWDYAKEVKSRTEDRPYIIHIDERHDKPDYDDATLTYFAEDDVLCDARDSVLDDKDEILGLENLQKFGHGSNDPNILYIRNDHLGVDFEVILSQGSYAHEVHGLTHSEDHRFKRRLRYDDE